MNQIENIFGEGHLIQGQRVSSWRRTIHNPVNRINNNQLQKTYFPFPCTTSADVSPSSTKSREAIYYPFILSAQFSSVKAHLSAP